MKVIINSNVKKGYQKENVANSPLLLNATCVIIYCRWNTGIFTQACPLKHHLLLNKFLFSTLKKNMSIIQRKMQKLVSSIPGSYDLEHIATIRSVIVNNLPGSTLNLM